MPKFYKRIKYTKEMLEQTLMDHRAWLDEQPHGIKASLSNARLSGFVIHKERLMWANFSGADLSYADLSYCDLRFANMKNTNLTGAILRGSRLEGADLTGAILINTDLIGAKFSPRAITPGEVLSVEKEFFTVACETGAVKVSEVQPESKPKMTVRDFLNGYSLKKGDLLE